MDEETPAGAFFEGSVFSNLNWSTVTDCVFQGCIFVGSDLSEARVSGSRFIECRFEGCDLSMWKPVDSVVGECHFEDCRMLGIDWTQASWSRAPLHEANVFVRCDLSMSTFADLDLDLTRFRECRLREVSFRFARLAGADFGKSDCLGADFHGADLTNAFLVEVTGLSVDPAATNLKGATVDASVGVGILESLGINLDSGDGSESPRER